MGILKTFASKPPSANALPEHTKPNNHRILSAYDIQAAIARSTTGKDAPIQVRTYNDQGPCHEFKVSSIYDIIEHGYDTFALSPYLDRRNQPGGSVVSHFNPFNSDDENDTRKLVVDKRCSKDVIFGMLATNYRPTDKDALELLRYLIENKCSLPKEYMLYVGDEEALGQTGSKSKYKILNLDTPKNIGIIKGLFRNRELSFILTPFADHVAEGFSNAVYFPKQKMENLLPEFFQANEDGARAATSGSTGRQDGEALSVAS